jgi:hypothetical protein
MTSKLLEVTGKFTGKMQVKIGDRFTQSATARERRSLRAPSVLSNDDEATQITGGLGER